MPLVILSLSLFTHLQNFVLGLHFFELSEGFLCVFYFCGDHLLALFDDLLDARLDRGVGFAGEGGEVESRGLWGARIKRGGDECVRGRAVVAFGFWGGFGLSRGGSGCSGVGIFVRNLC